MIESPAGATEREDELLSQSGRSRVVRQFVPGGSVVKKQPLEPGAAERARHETAMLERLAGVAGIAKLSDGARASGFVRLRDEHGITLADFLLQNTLSISELLDVALQLTDTLASVHRHGIVHRDINPSNILLVGPKRRPVLIDFDIASSFAEERPAFATQAEIEGTLAYIAPEQTGRTGRVLDQRADLYALGATLYELATGRTPFGNDDSFQVIRDHLVRVADSPSVLDRDVPEAFSGIIMRLLEKEPDRRYQSAEGLVADLRLLVERRARGEETPFTLGERDFPQRLLPPSRLIGRETEIADLHAAFEDALRGRCSALFVTGSPGVGKSALINELRSLATTSGGWFVAGKFDRYRQDPDSDAVRRAYAALFRLLLAEPEEELALLRPRLRAALGSYAAFTAALFPDLAVLLGIEPATAPEELRISEGRLTQNAIELLKCIVSPTRPVVFVVDDLQWASSAARALVDGVLSNPSIPGLLLVVAYRSAELDPAHPLTSMISRWRRGSITPREVTLGNLGRRDIGGLLQEMLRLEPEQAARLADAVGSRTGGNPYDTVELINGLRREGVLTPGSAGWNWNEAAIRRYVGEGDVLSRLSARIDALPAQTGELLEIVAILGGEVEYSLLQIADGTSVPTLEDRLGPALEDGLIVLERGTVTSVRFRHDRIQQAAYARRPAESRVGLQLSIARRLAAVAKSESLAVEQYYGALELVREPGECATVIALLRGAAARALLIANHAAVERFVRAAMGLGARVGRADDSVNRLLENELHVALYTLGRLEEADAVFAAITLRSNSPLALVDATCVQISSLTNRNRPVEAVALGLEMLGRIGLPPMPPRSELAAAVQGRLSEVYRWCDDEETQCAGQPVAALEPSVVAAAKLLRRLMPPAYFSDGIVLAWLVLESLRLWTEFGPRGMLVGSISHVAQVMGALREDYRIGYRVTRRILSISEERGYEPETSMGRFLFALCAQPWFEPLEDSVAQAHAAYAGLVQGGDLQNACFTYYASLPLLFQCATTVDEYSHEVEASLAFCLRTGNNQAEDSFRACRQLVRCLRGETDAAGVLSDASFDEGAHLAGLGENMLGQVYFHISRGFAALYFGKSDELRRCVDAAMPLLPFIMGTPITTLAYALHAIAYTRSVAAAAPPERAALLATLDASHDWLRVRANDAPANFLHFVRLIDAERAWAIGDTAAASAAFEAAFVNITTQRTPRHHAFLAERAGRFHLENGLGRYGRTLLADALRLYRLWGATGKALQLESEHAFLTSGRAAVERTERVATVSSDAMDMVGILRASQALSSQTSLQQLKACVVELLAGLTGATSVTLVIRRDATDDWVISAGGEGAEPVSIHDEGAARVLPLTAFRYVQRTREPLLLVDVTCDDRFSRDPYFAGCELCSLLVVPILSQGESRAVVLLENRLGRGAFSTNRLDAVMLIAGQLAVSLDNALLYASLERKVADRTEALAAANEQLARLSLTDAHRLNQSARLRPQSRDRVAPRRARGELRRLGNNRYR